MLPAGGAVLIRAWEGRSRTWRLVALTGGAVFTAIILQGQFYLYQFPPLLACLAYLAANELAAYRLSAGERQSSRRKSCSPWTRL
jgi:L-lactate permease